MTGGPLYTPKLIDLLSLRPGSLLHLHAVRGEPGCDQAAQWTGHSGWKQRVSEAVLPEEPELKRENMSKLLDIPVETQVVIRHEDGKVIEIIRLEPWAWDNLLSNAGRTADVLVDGRIIAHGQIVNNPEQQGVLITRLPG